MIVLSIDEILAKINREQKLNISINEVNPSEAGNKIQVLRQRASIASQTNNYNNNSSSPNCDDNNNNNNKQPQDTMQVLNNNSSNNIHESLNICNGKNDQDKQQLFCNLKREQEKLECLRKTSKETISTILPSTCNNLTTSVDKNNNTICSPIDEDEVSVVLITGCGSSIGCNIAVGFAQMGLRVALVDFDGEQIKLVASECESVSPKKSRKALQIVADISQLDQAHRVIDQTIEQFGRLDVLVNTVNNVSLIEAARIHSDGTGDDPHVFEQYHKIIANNMHAVTYLCISAAPYLRKTKGSIVNVSHLTQNESGSYKFAYCMSKAGIATLTKCLATDLAPDIKVICASPKSD